MSRPSQSPSSARRARLTRPLAVAVFGFASFAAACQQTDAPTMTHFTPSTARHQLFTDPGQILGFNIHAGYAGIATHMNDMGVNYARTEIDWYNPDAQFLYVTQTLDQLGSVQPYATVAYKYDLSAPHPAGAAWSHCGPTNDERRQRACVPDGTPSPNDNDDWDVFLADWKAFVGRAVTKFEKRITYWAPWNEPNIAADTSWFMGQPWQYDSLAKALCDTVHAVSARDSASIPHTLTCVGPELGVHQSADTVANWDVPWLTARLNAVNFDIVSAHIYAPSSTFYGFVGQVRQAMSAANAGSKSLWITETGHVSPWIADQAHDPESQDKGVYDKLTGFYAQSSVSALFFYDLQSRESGVLNDQNSFSKRPAYYAIKNMVANHSAPAPGAGLCSAASNTTVACDYTTDAPPDYDGIITARVIDYDGSPVSGINVVGYLGRGTIGYPYGYKTTNAAGQTDFRVRVHDGVTGQIQSNGVSVYNLPTGTSFGTGQSYYQDGIATEPTRHRTRTFVVTSGAKCTLMASAHDQNNNPVQNVGFTPYTGSTTYPNIFTNVSGIAQMTVNCSQNYGLATGTALLPAGVHLVSGDGNYAYYDNLTYPVVSGGDGSPSITTSVSRSFAFRR
jgi:hypothetical protein